MAMADNIVDDGDVNCLMLHPVAWPNHGPDMELYLGEEAIGLVKSMGWSVVKGPKWIEEEYNEDAESTDNESLAPIREELGMQMFDPVETKTQYTK